MVKQRFIAKLLIDGRITVPEGVREVLSLEKGDLVEITIEKTKPGTEVIIRGKSE